MYNKHFLLILAFFLGIVMTSPAQIIDDLSTQQLIRQGLDKMYNGEFAEAEQIYNTIQRKYPYHPVYPQLMAMLTSWKNFPMTKEKPAYQTYQTYLREALAKANEMLATNNNSVEAKFIALSAHGYLAMIAADEKDYMKSISEAKKAYNYVKEGFNLIDQYGDFYFTTGIYNFYVVQYPADHPVVKPFLLFFASGNKELGLQQINTAVQKAIFTGTESLFWLRHMYIKHEDQPQKALSYSEKLVRKYPNNLFYGMRHAEVLLLCGQYEMALPYINQLKKQDDKVFQMASFFFQGLIQEKHAENDVAAKGFYLKALNVGEMDKRYTHEYYAMAYAGLARIALREGKREEAKNYYKKALGCAEYTSTIREAKNYLKNASV